MRIRPAVATVAALLVVAACGRDDGRRAPSGRPSPAAASSPSSDPPATGAGPSGAAASGSLPLSPCPGGWDCAQQARFEAATAYIGDRAGQLGVVMRDRATGAIWRAGATDTPMWTGSTIKVAIATALLERQRAGTIHLTDDDRQAMSDMLRSSSNDATDALWSRYDGPGMLDRFRTGYGMGSLSVVAGRETYWRNLRCTADDLDHLMSYVLGDNLYADDRAYLVDTLRGVADNQHWGVWAAGPALSPGNKDGWAVKPDPGGEHWVTHTAGFAGPGERYVVVVMYSLPPDGTLSDGVQAVSDVAALLFGGQTPAPVSIPG